MDADTERRYAARREAEKREGAGIYATMSARDEDEIHELADEFAENGLHDVAEHLRENDIASTREFVEKRLVEAREDDRLYHHGEGFELHNLEVARDRLAAR